jgi:hypothetical protein
MTRKWIKNSIPTDTERREKALKVLSDSLTIEELELLAKASENKMLKTLAIDQLRKYV